MENVYKKVILDNLEENKKDMYDEFYIRGLIDMAWLSQKISREERDELLEKLKL